MASVANGVCNQCYVSITSQNKVLINGGKVLFCSSCGRMLYTEDK
jgi:predicted  nucleic acid-binding Zn-ribbon protein